MALKKDFRTINSFWKEVLKIWLKEIFPFYKGGG